MLIIILFHVFLQLIVLSLNLSVVVAVKKKVVAVLEI